MKTIKIAILSLLICATADAQIISPNQRMQPVVNPTVPAKVSFADKTYSTDRIDMYERLDRELTAMSYTHGNTLLMIKRAARLFPEMRPILRRNDVPDDLLYLACIESTLNPRAYSSAKAAGLWQFIPSTAKNYGLEVNDYVDQRYDTELATDAACRMLKSLYRKFGNWESAADAFNAGPARISNELEAQQVGNALDLYLVDETSRYFFRILAAKLIMENPATYGFIVRPEQLYTPIEYDVVEVSTPIPDWPAWAKEHGITYSQLREANMWIRDKKLPNSSGKTYRVRIPKPTSLNRSTAR